MTNAVYTVDEKSQDTKSGSYFPQFRNFWTSVALDMKQIQKSMLAGFDESVSIRTRLLDKLVTSEQDPKFALFKKQIENLRSLDSSWSAYQQESPNEIAIECALDILSIIRAESMVPLQIMPSAEGGVAIVFAKANKYADIECFNDGNVVISLSDNKGYIRVIETTLNSIRENLRTINEFFKLPTKKAAAQQAASGS